MQGKAIVNSISLKEGERAFLEQARTIRRYGDGQMLRDTGVAFLDATMVFEDVPVTLYIDACHFIPDGQRILAEAIAAEFLATYEP